MRGSEESAQDGAGKAGATFSFPASFAQERFWFLHRYTEGSPLYHLPRAFRIRGPLDRARLERALAAIVRRHESLRTALSTPGGAIVQVVSEECRPNIEMSELDGDPASPLDAGIDERLRRDARRPFDIERAPLFRAHLYRLGGGDHVLLVVFHHVITDGWSSAIYFRELSSLYRSSDPGDGSSLPELPIQYADFAAWQRGRFDDDGAPAQSAYWLGRLAGAPRHLDLPTDRPRPPVESFAGDCAAAVIDPAFAASLSRLARMHDATLFMVILAAFDVLLYRYSGQPDIVIGCPVANRTREEVEGLIGCFVNTLAMRADLSGDPPFVELLRRVRETAMDAFANQDMPFERLVDRLHLPRDPGRQPLFQVVLAMQNFEEASLRLEGLDVAPIPVHTGTSKFDLTMFVEPSDVGLGIRLEYSTDLFDRDRIERMLVHWRILLEGIAEEPTRRISQLPLMAPEERRVILGDWGAAAAPRRGGTIVEAFQEQAERNPEAIAIEFPGQRMTYGELESSANRLAHRLRAAGVSRNVPVCLCADRCPDTIVALLAILKACGAYVPLDPEFPKWRLAHMIQDTRSPVVLVQPGCEAAIPATGAARVMAIETDTAGEDPGPPPLDIGPGDLAYIIYTSGTTGPPKGVLVPHRGVVRLVCRPGYVDITPGDVFLQFAPISFDASTFEIWGALLNGAKLLVPPPGLPSLKELGRAISEGGVSILWLTAALFHEMVDHEPGALAGVRQLLAGGDVLSPANVRQFLALPGRGRLINGYGPTENTTFTCCCPIDRPGDIGATVPIGRPIAGTFVYILDAHGGPVPVGVWGELHAGGDGLALGYLNAPELTAEKFIPDPVSPREGRRVYRTGDVVRWLPDGRIEFLGRSDSQVKIRGFRIELSEIEAALGECLGVAGCAVLAREDDPGSRRLVAYVVPGAGSCPSDHDLLAHLRERLPEYMLPTAFVRLERLPLTSNGKLDREALPAPQPKAPAGTGDSSAPHNLMELELMRLWSRLFNGRDIGRDDNFFDLGGHSLLAARLVSEIEVLLGHAVPVARLFQAPTVAGLARTLGEHDWAPPWSSLVPLQPQGAQPPFFFSHGVGGSLYCFVDLARLLAPDQPVYGLQAVGLDGRMPHHASIRAMAAHYAAEIRSFQPRGPYYLGGYSLGGIIAYEVACNLVAQGEKVGMLALLDSSANCSVPWPIYARLMSPYFARRAAHHLQQWMSLPARQRFDYLKGRIAALRFHIVRNCRWPRAAPVPPRVGKAPPQGPDYFEALARSHRPSRYDGAIDLFLSEAAKMHHVSVWKYLASGEVRMHRASGNHLEMLDAAHVAQFARVFRRALERAQERADRTARAS